MTLPGFIGPQLPPDDVLFRRAPKLSRRVFRHRRSVLQDWLGKKAGDQPARYLSDDYYVRLGDDGRAMSVEEYLTIGYGNNKESHDDGHATG